MSHGISIREQSTSVKAMVEGDSAVTLVFGTAPINMVKDPSVNEPIMCLSYKEAVESFGSLKENSGFTILEAIEVMYSQYGLKKAIFVNVLDPKKHKKTQSNVKKTLVKDVVVLDHYGVKIETVVVNESDALKVLNDDYTLNFNEDGKLEIHRNPDGSITEDSELTIQYDYLDPSMVTSEDIIGGVDAATAANKGLEVIADVFPKYAIIPTIIIAPGYSHMKGVAQAMATKVKNINSVFHAIAIADIYDESITAYSKVTEYKNNNSVIDPDLVVCWPKATLANKEYWLSTHLASVISVVDSNVGGTPHVSPSNNALKIDGLINNKQVIKLGMDQANYLNENGVVTALNFIGGFKIWGNRTSAYPSNTDVKDMFISVRRTFSWVGNVVVTSFWQNLDIPVTVTNIENIVNNVQFWMSGLISSQVLLGGTISFNSDDNPVTSLLDGKVTFKIDLASPVPMEHITFILEYDVEQLAKLAK